MTAVPGHGTVRDEPVPVLWLTGPPGVGKTTVAWEHYSRLARSGTPVGYVDLDQLGICYPELPADPGRHRMQASNLAAVATAFRAAGAHGVVVSGVIDPVRGVPTDLLPQVALTECRLRAERDTLTRRLLGRRGTHMDVSEVLAEADILDGLDRDQMCLDTTGESAAAVARTLQERIGTWTSPPGRPWTGTAAPEPEVSGAGPHEEGPGPQASVPDGDGGPVLWLCGATAVGKSTVGFALYQRTVFGQGIPAAYVDLEQLGFLSPAPPGDPANRQVKARVLAALRRTFRAAGAEHLIVVGPVGSAAEVEVHARALSGSPRTVCLLQAGPETLADRVLSRGEGGSWPEPGDPLVGLPEAQLRDVARRAQAEAAALEKAPPGDLHVFTDGVDRDEIVEMIVERTGWPRPENRPRLSGCSSSPDGTVPAR